MIKNIFLKGVRLKEGVAKADNIKILEQSGNTIKFEIILHQGWNRQIRRMCEKVGLDVLELKRVRMGKLKLGDLKEGSSRRLEGAEIKKYFN